MGADFLAVAALEEANSNNLGFYNQVFHNFSPQAVSAVAPGSRAALYGEVGAEITQVGAQSQVVASGKLLSLLPRFARDQEACKQD